MPGAVPVRDSKVAAGPHPAFLLAAITSLAQALQESEFGTRRALLLAPHRALWFHPGAGGTVRMFRVGRKCCGWAGRRQGRVWLVAGIACWSWLETGCTAALTER
ncbi:hypothetical protein ACIOEX_04125 [Streptomyces sp. NPDC087850]|uniref:hypothetical protein n=1 Tax=Streptomyces sp. NPDC087850 TaxID=3365809 RepID=UPI0038294349